MSTVFWKLKRHGKSYAIYINQNSIQDLFPHSNQYISKGNMFLEYINLQEIDESDQSLSCVRLFATP